jgi:HD superfamily phosphohydrolase
MKINDRIYGEQIIKDEIINKLVKTKEIQRLKNISQHGTWHLIKNKISYGSWTSLGFDTSRFEHSLGVFFLLRKFNASLEEQIAGLIHDVSHFTFSHVIDYVFGENYSQEFAEKFNNEIIKNSLISSILRENDIDINYILDKHNFRILEKELPDICADRLDYLLRDCFVFGSAKRKLISDVLKSLSVQDGELVIDNENNAKQVAKIYLETSKGMWTNHFQAASYQLLANTIKTALERGFIREKDFYLTDDFLFRKLVMSKDKKILENIDILKNLSVKEGTKNDYDFHIRVKPRCIDPKFLDGDKIRRISNVDKQLKKDLEEFKERVNKGFYIKIIR